MLRRVDISFLVLMVQTQWRDRIVTSSFLIGVTIQTLMLSMALYSHAFSATDALTLAVRASCFTSVGILLFSAMSSIQNEFRFGTVENVLIGLRGLNQLVAYRAFATAAVSTPAIVTPFLFALCRYPELISAHIASILLLIYLFIFALCYQLSYVINAFEQPSTAISILKFGILIAGLRLLPGPWAARASLFLPSGWILALVNGEFSYSVIFAGFFAVVMAATFLVHRFCRPLVEAGIEDRLVSGRLS